MKDYVYLSRDRKPAYVPRVQRAEIAFIAGLGLGFVLSGAIVVAFFVATGG